MTGLFHFAGEHSLFRFLRTGRWKVISVRRWSGSFHRQYVLLERTEAEMTKVDPYYVPQGPDELPSFLAELDAVMAQLANPHVRTEITNEIAELAGAKGVVYRTEAGVDSCLRRAWPGLHHNIARKTDRILAVGKRWGMDAKPTEMDLALAQEAALDGEAETLYVTLRDAAVYLIHAMRYVRAQQMAAEHAAKFDAEDE